MKDSPIAEDTYERPSELDLGLGFDDVTDVICVGPGPGALAYAVACADLGLEVLLLDAWPADVTDEDTNTYLQAMTEDLDVSTSVPDLELRRSHAQPAPPPGGGKVRLEPFIGHQLRDWSAKCASSALGMLCTSVPDAVLSPFRTDSGEAIELARLGVFQPVTDRPGQDLVDWLAAQIDEHDIDVDSESTLERLVFHEGRVVGAAVNTPAGPQLIRAIEGVILSTPVSAPTEWPIQSGLSEVSARIAIVSRQAGRFARVELLVAD